MKKRSFLTTLNPGGILRWSTVCILAGGAAGLTGCDRSASYVATETDVKMAEAQAKIEELDQQQGILKRGEVANNFHLPRLGYYHAAAHDFFEHPYGFSQNGRWYCNGAWQDQPAAEAQVASSRPSPEALKKVDAALAAEQKELEQAGTGQSSGGHGYGMGNALMMYWLLAGNRGMFGGGAGFQQASGQAQGWQRGVESQRGAVGRYAAANPGYQRMVDHSRAAGTPVRPGQSVRGGFGSRSTGYSSGG
jgi:hypothetical protein